MADQNSSEWDKILSQRLIRESQSFPAVKPEDAGGKAAQPPQPARPPQPPTSPQALFGLPNPTDGTVAFDSGSVASAANNLREISAEGSVGPAPQGGQPGVPRGYGGITLGWAVGDNVAAVKEAQSRREALHSTIKTQDGIWSVGPPGTAARRSASDPGMVVDELRKLSPQDEQRAFAILRGGGRSGGKLLVAGLGIVAALLSAGAAVAIHARVLGEGELRLVAEIAPPEESAPRPVVAKPAPLTAKVEPKTAPDDASAPGKKPTVEDKEPAEIGKPPAGKTGPEIVTKPPEAEPNVVRSDARLVANDGPTFSLGAPSSKREWVDIAGPAIDFTDAPSVVEGDRPAP
jgi:hypothetical protein